MKPTNSKKIGHKVVVFLFALFAISLLCANITLASGDENPSVPSIWVTIENLGGSPAYFEADSFSLGNSSQVSACNLARAGAPKVGVQDFHMVKYTDNYTPLLAVSSLMGAHFQKVTIDVMDGETQIWEIVLGNAVISSFQQGGSGNGSLSDQLSFAYSTITWQYLSGEIKGWNVCQNAPYSPPPGE